MGFSGVDLTVRPKGHVLPESVKTDLPKAVSDIKSAGSNCQMITTSIESVNNPLDVDIIKTAAEAEIAMELSRASEELRSQVSTLAISGAEKILGKEIDGSTHAKALEELAAKI